MASWLRSDASVTAAARAAACSAVCAFEATVEEI
jgi:hypothetical protein